MRLKKVNGVISVALCACLLAGCSIIKISVIPRDQADSAIAENSEENSNETPPATESAIPTPSSAISSSEEKIVPEYTDNSSPKNESYSPDLDELEVLLNESEILYWIPDDYTFGTTDLDWTSIYAIASQWLRMYAARNGQEIPLNENGTPYFPIADFDTVTEELLGLSLDYAAWADKNEDVAPQGMLCVMWGYGTAYSELTVQKNSLETSDDQFSVIVENSVSSPGDNRDIQRKRLHFTVNPTYQFSHYRLVGVEDMEGKS